MCATCTSLRPCSAEGSDCWARAWTQTGALPSKANKIFGTFLPSFLFLPCLIQRLPEPHLIPSPAPEVLEECGVCCNPLILGITEPLLHSLGGDMEPF